MLCGVDSPSIPWAGDVATATRARAMDAGIRAVDGWRRSHYIADLQGVWCMTRFLVLGAFCLVVAGCDAVQSPAPRFVVENPYATPGTWVRGNFHVHTDHSDGALSGEETAVAYQRAGYGVLCITDHNQYGDQDGGVPASLQVDATVHDWNGDGTLHGTQVFGSGVEAYVRDWNAPPPEWAVDRWVQPDYTGHREPLVLLAGSEATFGDFHIGLVGYPRRWIEPPANRGLEYIDRTHDAAGFVYLAHPAAWNEAPESLQRAFPLARLDGLEIINGLWLTKNGAADATRLWDRLLARGVRLWGLANDDAHTWEGAPDAYPFSAFNMLLTADPSPEGYLAALRAGAFYASTGLLFETLALHADSLEVIAPGAERIRFIGAGGIVLFEVSGPRALYDFSGREIYVRVHAEASPASGASWNRGAWTQPFFLTRAPGD